LKAFQAIFICLSDNPGSVCCKFGLRVEPSSAGLIKTRFSFVCMIHEFQHAHH
jgi:hypothetical protein